MDIILTPLKQAAGGENVRILDRMSLSQQAFSCWERNEDALQKLVEELKGKGHSAVYVKADVGKEEDVNAIAETAIREFGRFDT